MCASAKVFVPTSSSARRRVFVFFYYYCCYCCYWRRRCAWGTIRWSMSTFCVPGTTQRTAYSTHAWPPNQNWKETVWRCEQKSCKEEKIKWILFLLRFSFLFSDKDNANIVSIYIYIWVYIMAVECWKIYNSIHTQLKCAAPFGNFCLTVCTLPPRYAAA